MIIATKNNNDIIGCIAECMKKRVRPVHPHIAMKFNISTIDTKNTKQSRILNCKNCNFLPSPWSHVRHDPLHIWWWCNLISVEGYKNGEAFVMLFSIVICIWCNNGIFYSCGEWNCLCRNVHLNIELDGTTRWSTCPGEKGSLRTAK